MDFRKTFFDHIDGPKNAFCEIGVAILGASVVGAAGTAYAASQAAGAQTDAAAMANKTANKMYKQTRADLEPYRSLGSYASKDLQERLPFLTSPIVMDQAALEKTPGYQFTRTQGLKGVKNAAAARGLGVSGAALKGAAAFTTGLADNTYQTQFNLENINRTNAYERLKGAVDTGENAAAQTGVNAMKTASTISSNTIGAGNAQAAAYNTMGAAGRGLASDVSGWLAYKGMQNDGSFTTTA